MKGTPIQWCDDTVNPVMGCDGCELWNQKANPPVKRCYSGSLHETRGGLNSGYARDFDKPERFPGRMAKAAKAAPLGGARRPEKPWLDALPRFIFVSDMGDAMSRAISFYYLKQEIIDVVSSTTGASHRWLWLTKQPKRMADFSEWLSARGLRWPENLWAGTSITSAPTSSRVVDLLRVGDETTTRFLSVEPQFTSVDLSSLLSEVDWVIHGGESGADAQAFHLEWARDLLGACKKAGVPYFLKQLGKLVFEGGKEFKLEHDRAHGGDPTDWPEDLRVRQVPREGTLPTGGGERPVRRAGRSDEHAATSSSAEGRLGAPPGAQPKSAKSDLLFKTTTDIANSTRPDVAWVAQPWVAERAITLVDGKPKVAGKSTWMLRLIKAVLSGEEFLSKSTNASGVVLLTEERPETLRRSLERAGLLEAQNLHVLFHQDLNGVPWPSLMSRATAKCQAVGAKLLVVDTLGQFCPGSERSGENAFESVAPLQKAAAGGLAVVCVRHERKSGGDVGDSARGSSVLTGAADIILAIQRPPDHDGPVRIIRALSRFSGTPAETWIELRDGEYVDLAAVDADGFIDEEAQDERQ